MTPSPTQTLKRVLESVLSGKGATAALFHKPYNKSYRIVIEVQPEEVRPNVTVNIEALR